MNLNDFGRALTFHLVNSLQYYPRGCILIGSVIWVHFIVLIEFVLKFNARLTIIIAIHCWVNYLLLVTRRQMENVFLHWKAKHADEAKTAKTEFISLARGGQKKKK